MPLRSSLAVDDSRELAQHDLESGQLKLSPLSLSNRANIAMLPCGFDFSFKSVEGSLYGLPAVSDRYFVVGKVNANRFALLALNVLQSQSLALTLIRVGVVVCMRKKSG